MLLRLAWAPPGALGRSPREKRPGEGGPSSGTRSCRRVQQTPGCPPPPGARLLRVWPPPYGWVQHGGRVSSNSAEGQFLDNDAFWDVTYDDGSNPVLLLHDQPLFSPLAAQMPIEDGRRTRHADRSGARATSGPPTAAPRATHRRPRRGSGASSRDGPRIRNRRRRSGPPLWVASRPQRRFLAEAAPRAPDPSRWRGSPARSRMHLRHKPPRNCTALPPALDVGLQRTDPESQQEKL